MDIEVLINGLVYSFPKKEGNYHVSAIKCADGNEFRLTSSFLNLVDIFDKENLIVLSVRKEKVSSSREAKGTVEPYTKTVRFYNDIVKLEENIVQNMSKSSESWFRKNIPLHKLESMFRSCISRTSELGHNIFRFKLSKKLKIFNESEENVISLDELKALDKNSFRLQCSCLIDSLIIGRDAAKLDIKVTQIRIKKNPPAKAVLVEEPPSNHSDDDELDEDTFDCVEQILPTEPCDAEQKSVNEPVKEVQLSEAVRCVAGEAPQVDPLNSTQCVDIKKEETLSRISELKKQLRQAADEDNDDRVAELSIEIKELKKLLA